MSDAAQSPLHLQVGMSHLLSDSNSSAEVAPPLSNPCENPAASAPGWPTRPPSEAGSVLSTASDYLAQPVLLSGSKSGSTTESGVPVKVAAESPRKLALVIPTTPTHHALINAVPFTSQFDTVKTTISSTSTNAPVSDNKMSIEEAPTEAKSSPNTPPMLPALDFEAGAAPEQGHGWYLGLPSMLFHLRRQSASSDFSVDSLSKLVVGMKSEASTRPAKV